MISAPIRSILRVTTLLPLSVLLPCVSGRPQTWLPQARHVEVTSSSKAGLGWGGGDVSEFTSTGKVTWYYTWGPDPVDSSSQGDLEFVPMLWGQKNVDEWPNTINNTITSNNVTAILGMNEPQEKGQANLTPEEGAAMWKTYIEPLRSAFNVRLGSPAPSSAPSGKTWIQDFLTACNGDCTLDFIAFHWYDVNATKFKNYVQDFHDTFQRPLWITEWACQNFNNADLQCSPDDIALFMNDTQSFMDNTDYVERYAWFGAFSDTPINKDTALVNDNGQLNDLGKQYIGEEGPQTSGNGSGSADGPPGQLPGPIFDAASSLHFSALRAAAVALSVALGALIAA